MREEEKRIVLELRRDASEIYGHLGACLPCEQTAKLGDDTRSKISGGSSDCGLKASRAILGVPIVKQSIKVSVHDIPIACRMMLERCLGKSSWWCGMDGSACLRITLAPGLTSWSL